MQKKDRVESFEKRKTKCGMKKVGMIFKGERKCEGGHLGRCEQNRRGDQFDVMLDLCWLWTVTLIID